MNFKSSQISITSLTQKAVFYSHNELTPLPVFNGIVSRVAGLLLSPAAAIDFAIHTTATPLSFLYAIGKSIILWRADFHLPWQHLQRVREAVFPILLGSIAGIIHPYAGIYCTEPKDKHIAGGILLSNTEVHNNVIVSPISAFDEIHEIMRSTSGEWEFPEEYSRHIHTLTSWEKPLQMVQAAEIFDLKIATKGMSKIYRKIDDLHLSEHARGIGKRVSLIAFPILAAIDFTIAIVSAAFLLSVGIVQLTGAKCPAYLETTNSPVLHVYNVGRIIMTALSAIIGLGVSLVNPENGLEYSYSSSCKYKGVKALMYPIYKRLNREVKALNDGERLVLPIVIQSKNRRERDFLPSRNSHMTYLLIERKKGTYSAEFIERGNYHGIIRGLTLEEISKIGRECLSLRYQSIGQNLLNVEESIQERVSKIGRGELGIRYLFSAKNEQNYIEKTFKKEENLVKLGKQGSFTNCVVTNLFAVFNVLSHRDKEDQDTQNTKVANFRKKSMDRYDHYQYDFFPFAPMATVIDEILALKSKKI